ncbi:LPS translocon maturation chaperone LptM [Novimethylophilus kurashikiensis]|nr:lipoprotein [Novimethylophilus kurashikiensis]
MRKLVEVFALVAVITLLYGCGTRGPLYLPEQRYPQPQQDK